VPTKPAEKPAAAPPTTAPAAAPTTAPAAAAPAATKPAAAATTAATPAAAGAATPVPAATKPAAVAASKPITMPTPGNMPAGSFMKQIQDRGKLIAGVKGDVKFFGWLNPRTSQLEGFDVDVVKEIAKAIFGDPTKIELKQVTSANRIPQLREGVVDIVAATMTITKPRLDEIDFSDVYYEAQQLVLVPKSSAIKGASDLANKKVCAAKGSTSERNIVRAQPTAQVLQADTYTECLLAVQQGRADAVSTDDVILSGLADQDPNMHIVGTKIADEPYGLGIAKGKEGFVPFVNGVMAQLRTTGRWKEIHKQWLGQYVQTPEPPTRGAQEAAV
jgi:polar amino acid transport system substrate-binding protein